MTEFKPKANISTADLMFPAKVYKDYFPPMPIEELMRQEVSRAAKKLMGDWFYLGLKRLDMKAKPGIDSDQALKHIKCIMSSFEPKHEHKTQAVAYLLDLWFENWEYEVAARGR